MQYGLSSRILYSILLMGAALHKNGRGSSLSSLRAALAANFCSGDGDDANIPNWVLHIQRRINALSVLLVIPALALAQSANTGASSIKLDSMTKLEPINGRVQWVDYRGRNALHLAPLEGHEHDTDQEMIAVLTGSDFRDGTIEIDVSGARRSGYSKAEDTSGYKGFVGLSFRVRGDSAERFYVRPENSRLNNQIFRNFSTQYESSPDYSWGRLRDESRGVYESYVDLEPGAWTSLKIEVSGHTARLFVNGASQPCLIVNDLKLGESHGAIALWARISTESLFFRTCMLLNRNSTPFRDVNNSSWVPLTSLQRWGVR